ncbi:MAG: hypothetical protein KF773_29250 [Deltaproteobacteria bacterium]|nr:hypothetical protein [Deltaproteobacteria bacterium]MCW5806061.1 hypothetical protein [Deltaproteobacteria bacterium]
MARMRFVMVMAAACGGGPSKPPPPPAPPPDAPQGSPIEEGCKAFELRCPWAVPTMQGQCKQTFAEGGTLYEKCRSAGKLEAYTTCLLDDCFKEVKCDKAVVACMACADLAGCTDI